MFRRWLRRTSSLALVTAVAATAGCLLAATPAAASTVTGSACGPNEGVTIVVDFSPTSDELLLGCAPGPQSSISAAMVAAGFSLTTEATGFGNYLCAINGVAANPGNCQAFPGPYWSGFLNTTDGNPGGPLGTAWTSANVGVDGGPLPVSAVVGYIQNTDGSWPGPSPRLDLTALPPPDNTTVPPTSYGPGTGDATAVAGWIGRQLAASGGLLNGSVGFTVDAIYALAAAGVGGDQIAASAAAVAAAGPAYIGTPADGPTRFGRVAKVALALQIAGLDPTAYPDPAGPRDLLAELRAQLNADGSFGAADEPFVHAFAVLALSRTAAGVPQSAVAWLAAQRCTDPSAPGAFGYAGCASADVDYTALAVQALLAAGVDASDPVIADALDWLGGQQTADGGIGGNTNSTGLGGQAFAAATRPARSALAAAFIGGLQVSCDDVLATGSALVDGDVGAIAWTPAALADAAQFGIDADSLGQWQYASVQAVFGLGTVSLGDLTAAGADPALPADSACVPPATSSPTTPVETATAPAPDTTSADRGATSSVPEATTAVSVLSATGPSQEHLTAQLVVAALLLILGIGLVVAARSTARHR